MADMQAIRRREKRAFARRDEWAPLIDDVYRYVLPYREGLTRFGRSTQSRGQARVDHLFDSTPTSTAIRFAGRMQNDITPPFVNFVQLEAGPLLQAEIDRKGLNEELAQASKLVQGVLSGGAFEMASHEMYLDLFAGTGAMQVREGSDETLADFVSTPAFELGLEPGANNEISGVFHERGYTSDELRETWPDARFSAELEKRLSDADQAEGKTIRVVQYTRAIPRAERSSKGARYRLTVYAGDISDDPPIFEEEYLSNPWTIARFLRVPGEVYGRGPGMFMLPSVRTLNKARELALKQAAYALLGLWVARDDGVFNPDTATMAPGAILTVANGPGPLGQVIKRLPMGDGFDVSMFVVDDERMQIKQAGFDNALPPEAGAVRSPTEILERKEKLAQDYGGIYGRLVMEVVRPTVQRTLDLLGKRGFLEIPHLTLDQLVYRVVVRSPVAAAQQASAVRAYVEWLEILGLAIGQENLRFLPRVQEAMIDIARNLQIDERLIPSLDEIQKMEQQLAALAQAQMQQDQGDGPMMNGAGA
ncbi:MAG: portal protein [Pseudomonadota bacterium]